MDVDKKRLVLTTHLTNRYRNDSYYQETRLTTFGLQCKILAWSQAACSIQLQYSEPLLILRGQIAGAQLT